MGRFTWLQVEQRLKEIAVEMLGLEPHLFNLEADWFAVISGDSLDAVEYIMACEELFRVEIPDEILVGSRSIADVLRNFIRDNPNEVFDIVDTQILSFQLQPDGHINVSLQLSDGSWVYADGSGQLPSRVFVSVVGEWSLLLEELEDMVNDPNCTEQDLQDFLEAHPKLLAGDEFDRVIPQAIITRDEDAPWRADFLLAPVNQTQFAKVIDLKLPREKLTTSPKSGHHSFSAKVFHSIGQIRDYGRAFDDPKVRDKFRARYGVDVYKPDLQLIIGRKWDMDWIDDLRVLKRESQVSIDTWDDILEGIRRHAR